MYYKLIERFGPEDGERWQNYLEWRGLNLSCFDSVDGILRPDLFTPESDEDWRNCVNEDHKLCLITNLEYAQKIRERYENSVLIGVEIELKEGYIPKEGLLGFDIIDGYCDVSLVTNWGDDEDALLKNAVLPNGLIQDFTQALHIRDSLRQEFSEDGHAESCEVWAIYRIEVS